MTSSPASGRGLIWAVIPAYNEAAHVGAVVRGVTGHGLPVLVVDDGSSDGTAEAATAAGAMVIRQPRNSGKGEALRAGFAAAAEAGAEAVITLDADGQHSPDDMPAFLDAYRRTGASAIIGNRMADPAGMPRLRRWTNRWMSWLLSRRMRQRVPDTQNGFRLYRTDLLSRVQPEAAGFAAESEILLRIDRLGLRLESVPVRTLYGAEQSSIRPVRDTLRFLRMLWRCRRTR